MAALTTTRIDRVAPKGARFVIWDDTVPGLGLRVEPSGRKIFYVRAQLGSGTKRRRVELRIGDARAMPLAAARAAALRMLAEVRDGVDPRHAVDDGPVLAAHALDRYGAALERRGHVRRKDVVSAIRREIVRPGLTMNDVDRKRIAAALDRLERAGKAGAAGWLRKSASAWLAWAEGEGLVDRNPLGGWRRPRTRAEALKPQPVADVKAVWEASAELEPGFRAFVRLLALTGQRRGEAAQMQWSDLDLGAGVWTIPAAHRKTGVAHVVPLGPVSRALLAALPVQGHLVFPGRTGGLIAGWTKRVAPLKAALGKAFGLHGLRRAYRTGLGELGVQTEIAELMIGHARAGLVGLYDKSTLMGSRRAAQERWEAHVAALVADGPLAGVIELADARRVR